MKAVHLTEYGAAENMKIVGIPVPEPAENEVLIKVHSASVIFADILMRRGDYPALPASLPFVPGREVAGIAERVGSKVTSIRPGMRVLGQMHTGAYAEYAKTTEDQVFALPERVDYFQGLVYFANLRVAYMVYYVFGKVQPGQTILIHAASGGVGSLIIQIAKRKGNNVVIALGETDEKLDFCRAVGADHAINTSKSDYVKEVMRITNDQGVDVSLNSVGGPTLETDPDAIKPLGRWAIFGYAAGKGRIDPFKHFLKSLTITASSIYTYMFREETRHAMDYLKKWLNTEDDLLSVTKTFPLEEIIQAHHWFEDQHSIGKIAVVMEP